MYGAWVAGCGSVVQKHEHGDESDLTAAAGLQEPGIYSHSHFPPLTPRSVRSRRRNFRYNCLRPPPGRDQGMGDGRRAMDLLRQPVRPSV